MFFKIFSKNLLFPEDSKQSGAASGHGSINGSLSVNLLFKGGNSRMTTENRWFKVVYKNVFPIFRAQ